MANPSDERIACLPGRGVGKIRYEGKTWMIGALLLILKLCATEDP